MIKAAAQDARPRRVHRRPAGGPLGARPGPNWTVQAPPCAQTKGRGREILVRIDPYDVDGSYLERVAAGTEPRAAWPSIFVSMPMGAEKFGQLTSHNLPDTGHRLLSPLGHRARQRDALGAARSTARFATSGRSRATSREEEVEFLVGVLNAGSLPATLRPEPISQQRISSQLGDDTIRKGTMSMVISTAADPDLHGGLLPLLRHRGRHRRGAQHDRHRGADDPDQGRLHPARPGRPGADRRHGGRRQRADLRADARGNRTRGVACGWPSATASRGPWPRSSTRT